MNAQEEHGVSKSNVIDLPCDPDVRDRDSCPRCGSPLTVRALRTGWVGKLCSRCDWWRLEDEQGVAR